MTEKAKSNLFYYMVKTYVRRIEEAPRQNWKNFPQKDERLDSRSTTEER